MNDLREYIYSKNPNDVVELQISRGRINKNISITLRKKMRRGKTGIRDVAKKDKGDGTKGTLLKIPKWREKGL